MVYKNLFKTKRTDDWKKVQNFRNIVFTAIYEKGVINY